MKDPIVLRIGEVIPEGYVAANGTAEYHGLFFYDPDKFKEQQLGPTVDLNVTFGFAEQARDGLVELISEYLRMGDNPVGIEVRDDGSIVVDLDKVDWELYKAKRHSESVDEYEEKAKSDEEGAIWRDQD